MRAERSRNADDDRVALAEAGEVGGGDDVATAGECLRDSLRADVADIRLAARQRRGLRFIDVEADDRKTRFLEEQHERQADVAEADDADACGAVGDPRKQTIALFV